MFFSLAVLLIGIVAISAKLQKESFCEWQKDIREGKERMDTEGPPPQKYGAPK